MTQNKSTLHSEIDFERQSTLVSGTNKKILTKKDDLLHGIELFLVTLGLGCAVFLAALDQTIVATALSKIVSDFNGLDQIAWVATSYLLTMVSMIIYCAIAGIGGSGITGLALIIVSDIVSTKDRGIYQGILGACFGIASIAGPLMGGAFTDHISWRWCFLINLPLGAITIIVIIFFLRMKKPTGSLFGKFKRIDFIGIIIMMSSTVSILLPLNWGGSTYAWDSPVIIVLLCVGAVGLIIFSLVERYIVFEPVAPPATHSRIDFMPYILGAVVSTFIAGHMFSRTDKIPFRYATLFASSLSIIGGGLITMWKENTGYGELIGYMIIGGTGIGKSAQCILLYVQGLVEYKDISSVTTLSLFFRTFGAVFGIALSGTAFNNKLSQELNKLTLPPSFSTKSVYTI
ncbi:MFS general substrate transporter [Gigaspora margarita]|uniref:MFS general substrate transporter n=1 Tax=Gigaspora margarita TaxID=4874 RepID=A0A8H3X0X5_GIGMA|nr:MFS general substrate transporter [Gigaspora margarita]